MGDAHGAHQILTEQHQSENVGIARCGLSQGIGVVGQACAGEGDAYTSMLASVDAGGSLT